MRGNNFAVPEPGFPVRSSLLFNPSSTTSPPPPTLSETENSLDNSQDLGESFNASSASISKSNDNTYRERNGRRKSEFRSKSTDNIPIASSVFHPNYSITNDFNTGSSNGYISQTPTTNNNGHGYSHSKQHSSKFQNINVSQPILSNMPDYKQSTPIPATRFDTITSYVDVIYQQQQLQQQQQQQLQGNSEREDFNDENNQSVGEGDENIVYLNPSDGIDGDQSFMATCPHCAMMVMTETDPFPGSKSHKMACIFTPLLLCWLPIYWKSIGKKWMDVRHQCPKCRSTIAIYQK